jgi:ceramide glucosyltransferase
VRAERGRPEHLVHFLTQIIGWTLLVLSLTGAVYFLLAASVVARFMAVPTLPAIDQPSVTLLKPLHFDSPGLEQDLDTFLAQDYEAPVQIVFGVQDANDPAIAIVEHLKARHRSIDIEFVIDTRAYGHNAKISNLINMAERARNEVIVLSDSDISVTPDWLSKVVGELLQPGVGAVTCPYTGLAGTSAWSTLAAMGTSYDFLPSVVFGTWWGIAHACLGSTIALRKATLAQIGGFEAFRDFLADDYEMGRAVRQRGLRVAVLPFAVSHRCTEQSIGELLHHELRWSRTIRVLRPIEHIGTLVTYPLPLALAAIALLGSGFFCIAAILATIGARIVLKYSVESAFKTCAGPLWLMPVRDIISFAVFLLSFFGQKVAWRGARYEVRPSGAMSQL